MNIGRVVDGAASRVRGAAPRPASDLERKLRAAERALRDAQAAVEQAEADERDLGALSADDYLGTIAPGEYDRRAADVQLRLVEGRHEVERWTTIVGEVRDRAIAAVNAEISAQADEVLAERAKLEHERERLIQKVAELDRADSKLVARLEVIDASRLPALARFDPDAAEALAARERALEREAVQLAHARIRGEDVEVPEHLAALVRKHEPLVRGDIAERRRLEREHLRRIGSVPLVEYKQGGPAVRDPNLNLGFSDDED